MPEPVLQQIEIPPKPGPGLGNLSHSEGDLFSPISMITSSPKDRNSTLGHGNVAMVNGYLMVIYSSDGGGRATNGGIEFWDISNPRKPRLYRQHDNRNTHGLREAHGFGFSSSYRNEQGGIRDLMVAQAVEGIQIWDLTVPEKISLVSYMNLPGITRGDYTGSWWAFWQAPYIYVAGTDHGLYIVDATDPANPQLANHLPGHKVGGLNPAQTFAVGNLLVVMASRSRSYATFDISNPIAPALIDRLDGRAGYSHLFAAGKILTSGGNDDANQMFVHNVTHAGHISYMGSSGQGLDNGGYGSYQDGFFHSGFSKSYAKFEVANLQQMGTGTSSISERDEDFATVLGNLVWAGSDHGDGSALIVHQIAPDTLGPQVDWIHPASGSEGLPATTRIGLSMSDMVDVESLNQTTFQIRPQGGAALAGKYSSQMGLVNFSPDQPLQAGTTYEVIVEGILDYVGNRSPLFHSSFTVGQKAQAPAVSTEPEKPEPEQPEPEKPKVVYAPLQCEFLTAPVGVNKRVDFITKSNNGTVTYEWDWGDGSTQFSSLSSTATHSFTQAGRFPIVLSVSRAETQETMHCTNMQIVYHAQTERRPSHSSALLYANRTVFTVNSDNNTVTALDGATLSKKWEAMVGHKPTTLAITPNNHSIWVVNQDSAEISVLHAVDGTVKKTIQLPLGSQPYGVVFNPDQSAAYITLQATGGLAKLDRAGNIVKLVQLGGTPRGVAVTADGERILGTQFIASDTQAEVKMLSAEPFALLHTITLDPSIEPDSESGGRGLPNYLSQIVISPDGLRALIPSKKDNIGRGLLRDGNELTFESQVRTIVSQIDLTTNQERFSDRIDLDNQALAQSVIFSPYGDLFFVANLASNAVQFYETATGNFVGQIMTGNAPQGLVLNDDGSRLFVQNSVDRAIAVYDVADLVNGRANSVRFIKSISTVEQEQLTPRVLLGKRIFYNAADPRMSKDGYLSCASCHLEGGHDGRTWDMTQQGEGVRNTPTLKGFAEMGPSTIHWTANFDEIEDFENVIRDDFAGTGFMDDADFKTVQESLGNPKANLSDELDALAAYVNSLASIEHSPHRETTGELTAQGADGRRIFEREGCATCHAGQKFSDSTEKLLHNIGTIKPTSGQRMGEPLLGVDTPTLRGLWTTAPYLHDGSAATLADAVKAHANVTLPDSDLTALVAYLLQIDQNEVIAPATGDLLFDFGNGAVAAEHIPVLADEAYAAEKGYGFVPSSVVMQRDRNLSGALTSDFVFSPTAWSFLVDLPNGVYKLTLTTGDDLAPQNAMIVTAESKTIATSQPLEQGEIGYIFLTTEVTDGQLSLVFVGNGEPTRLNSLHIRLLE